MKSALLVVLLKILLVLAHRTCLGQGRIQIRESVIWSLISHGRVADFLKR